MRAPPSIDWSDEMKIRQEIEDLNADFCHHLDHGDTDALLDLFTPDAHYTHGPRHSQGRAEIAQVFERRTSMGPRTSRHIQSGLRIVVEAADRARASSVCLTFAADGNPPIQAAQPLLVADFDDKYRCCDDGRWRIAERHIRRIFEDSASIGPVGMPDRDASRGAK